MMKDMVMNGCYFKWVLNVMVYNFGKIFEVNEIIEGDVNVVVVWFGGCVFIEKDNMWFVRLLKEFGFF